MGASEDSNSDKPNLRAHTNAENVRKCPFCEEEVLSRGLYMHVFNSDNNSHGPRNSVPDDFDPQEAEIVGKRKVNLLNPTEYNIDHRRFICGYCGKVCKGELGLNIHLGRVTGDENHPEDAKDRDIESFNSFPATEAGEIIVDSEEQAEELEGINADILINESDQPTDELLTEAGDTLEDSNSIPISELKKLRDKFIEDDENNRNVSAYHASERINNLIEDYS